MTTAPHPRRALSALVALTLGLTAFLAPTESARAAVTQGITGTVTLPNGGPGLTIIDVDPVDPGAAALPDNGQYWTEEDGTFAVALPAGQYWVRFIPPAGAAEWWGDSATRAGSDTVTVASGSLSSISPTIEAGGSISGIVAQAEPGSEYFRDGVIEVFAADSTYPDGYFRMGMDTTDASGHYLVPNLPTGSYRIHFYTRTHHLEGWWGNATTSAASTPVTVTAPAGVTGISPTQLVAQGSISGTLTHAADEQPISGAVVDLFYRDEDGTFRQGGDSTYTDGLGAYSLQAPTGTYRIKFSAAASKSEYWDDATTLAGAQSVTVTIGQPAGADAVLEPTSVVNLALPTISGTPRVGRTLTATAGLWYPLSSSLTYRWFRGAYAIDGAVKSTYVPTAADVGKLLKVRVTVAAVGYSTRSVFSQPTVNPVARGLFKLLSEPTITGRLQVGYTLRATPPRTSPTARVRYQWRRGGVAIRGATSATYTLIRADRGRRMSVAITLTRLGYVPVTRIVTRTTLVR